MKPRVPIACVMLLLGVGEAQIIKGPYEYWNRDFMTQELSILTPSGVYASLRDPGCGDTGSLRDQIGDAPERFEIKVIYQHYSKSDEKALGYQSVLAKNSLRNAPGWSFQGKCTMVLRFETANLEFSDEARRVYKNAYKSTDYIVVFQYDTQVLRYTFASP